MHNDHIQELTPQELVRRQRVDAIWDERYIAQVSQNTKRLHNWWERWADRLDMLWALGSPTSNKTLGRPWKWQKL